MAPVAETGTPVAVDLAATDHVHLHVQTGGPVRLAYQSAKDADPSVDYRDAQSAAREDPAVAYFDQPKEPLWSGGYQAPSARPLTSATTLDAGDQAWLESRSTRRQLKLYADSPAAVEITVNGTAI